MTTHTYSTSLVWEGSTGPGYRSYLRDHQVSAAPADASLTLSADPAFLGDAHLLNPEQLLVIATSSCQLLAFLAVAAQHGIDVLGYNDQAEGVMDDRHNPVHISAIRLRPVIRVAAGTDPEEIPRLVELAHQSCYIANSLVTRIEINATVVTA